MPRINQNQTNFTAGFLSKRLRGRVDIAKYANGAKEVTNFIVLPHGGLKRRGGTVYAAEVKNSAVATRAIPFEFSTIQAYIIELGAGYFRFYRDNAPIVEQGTITGVTQANPAVVTSTAHPFSNGETVTISGIVGMAELNNRSFTIANTTANTYELQGEDSTLHFAYISGGLGTVPYEIANPYAAAELFDIQFAQSADVLWLVHPNHKPRKLSRTGHTAWTLINYAPTTDPFTSANNYPRAVGFFEQRLFFGGTNVAPQTIFSTRSALLEDMTPGTADADGLRYTIASGKVNVIQWLMPSTDLLVGTLGAEYRVSGGNNPLTPSNITIKVQTTNKCAAIQPMNIDTNVLYVQRARRKLREMEFSFEKDGFISSDLTILAKEITDSGIVQLDFQQEPDSVIWAVKVDGDVAALTFEKKQDVIGWHKHTTNGKFESVAVIPLAAEDQTWFVVNRTINGQTKRYMEYLSSDLWTDQKDGIFVDSALSYSGVPVSSLTGLEHLEGEIVDVLADGAPDLTQQVSDGGIVLETPASTVHVGLPYFSTLKTLEPEGGLPNGSTQGKTKAPFDITIRVVDTLGGAINGQSIDYRAAFNLMDTPITLQDGDFSVKQLGYSTDAEIRIDQILPLPMQILSIIYTLDQSDD